MKRTISLILLVLTLGASWAMPQIISDAAGICYRIVGEGRAEVMLGDAFYRGDVTIPAAVDGLAVQGIGYAGMNACHGLKSVTLPEGLTAVGDYAFNACDSMRTVNLPSTLERIGNHAFNGCFMLTMAVEVPDACNAIGAFAFSNCRRITAVQLGSGVSEVGERAFQGCLQLTSIIVSGDNAVYADVDGVLYDAAVKRLIAFPRKNVQRGNFVMPETVTSIEGYAFYANDLLKAVVLPDALETIGDRAFYGTKIKTLTLGESIASIGTNAFANCSSLKEVHCAQTTPLGLNPYRDPFGYFSDKSDMTLYVPAGSLDAYREAPVWREFGSFVEETAGINDINEADARIKVRVDGLNVIVDGAAQGALVRVYNVSGQLVTQTADGMATLPAAGVYVIDVEGVVFKVAAR